MAGRVVYEAIYPNIEKSLKDKNNVLAMEKVIGRYIDKNSDKLSKIGPMDQILFVDYDRQALYDICNIQEKDIADALKKSKDIYADKATLKVPFTSFSIVLLHYFLKVRNGAMFNLVSTYYTLSIYPLLYKKYFKYPPNENIMAYTINNLSEKYKIKQAGSLFVALNETTDGALEHYKDKLMRCNDEDIKDIALAVRTRMNSLLKNIRNEFEKNYREERYLNTEFESNDLDNFHEAEASIHDIERIADKVVNKLITYGPNIKLITIAAKTCTVSVNELRNYINTLITNENRDDIKKMTEAILYLFLIETHHNPKQINSDAFIIDSLEIYKKSNTNDTNIKEIKRILDKWMDDVEIYKKTQRFATLNNFRRALFTFFIITIQNSNL